MGLLDFMSGSTDIAPNTTFVERPGAQRISDLLLSVANSPAFTGPSQQENQGLNLLSQILSGGTFQDPRSSDLYQGLRQESLQDEEMGVNALRRRQQLSGAYNSSGGARGEALLRSRSSANRQQLLGGLYNQERNRDNPYTRLGAVSQMGGLERGIAGQRAGILQNLLNLQSVVRPTSGLDYRQSPSEYSQWSNAIGNIGQVAGTAMSLFSDERLKDDIKRLDAKVCGVIPLAIWSWNDKAEEVGLSGKSKGVIAQDVQEHYPELIGKYKGTEYLCVDYAGLLIKHLEWRAG